MSDRDGVLLEDINSKLDGLTESISVMGQRLTKVEQTTDQILEILTEFPPLKAAVIDRNEQLEDHESRLQILEMPQRV